MDGWYQTHWPVWIRVHFPQPYTTRIILMAITENMHFCINSINRKCKKMPSVHLIYIQCTSTKYFYWNYWWARAGANVCACAKTTKQEILARLRLRFEWCDIQQNDKMWTNKSTENRTYAMHSHCTCTCTHISTHEKHKN